MKFNKKGALNLNKMINYGVLVIIAIVVLFELYAVLVPEAQSAGNTLNSSGVPFGSFFVSDGIVFLLVMIGLFLLVLKLVMPSKK